MKILTFTPRIFCLILFLSLCFLPDRSTSQCTEQFIGYEITADNIRPLPFCDIITFEVTVVNLCPNDGLTDVIAIIGVPNNVTPYGSNPDFPFDFGSEFWTTDFELGPAETKILHFQMQVTECPPTGGTPVFSIFSSVTDSEGRFGGDNRTILPEVCREANGSLQILIAQGVVPNQSEACDNFFHKFYHVENQLIVDVSGTYCITKFDPNIEEGAILLDPGASIVIKSGAHLYLSGIDIFGCQEMWESIIVEANGELTLDGCNIQDGINAIKALDGSKLYIRDCNFTNNLTGIQVPINGGVQQTVTFNHFINNHFKGVGLLKPPYGDQIPIAGISVSDLSMLSVDYFEAANTAFNFSFENMWFGITAFRSNINVDRAIFKDILIDPATGKGGFGIKSIGAPNICQVNGYGKDALSKVMFDNCTVGILSNRNFLDLYDIRMKQVNTGISVSNSEFNINLIRNNRIEASEVGIDLFGQAPLFVGLIEGNWLEINHPDSPAFSFGIRLNGAPFVPGFNKWTIENNFIYLQRARHGISLTGGANTDVRNNTLFMQDPTIEIYNGISILGSPNTTVECNNINGNVVGANYKAAIGIINSGSAQSFIGCNNTNNTNVGINFWDMCLGTEVYGNTIGTHQTGLLLGLFPNNGNAFIGEQDLLGNQWPGHNATDDFPGDELEGARHLGTDFVIGQSEFIVDATPLSSQRQYMPSVETPFSNNNDWFSQENGSNYACNLFPCNGYSGLVGGGDDKLSEHIATNQLATDGFDIPLCYTGARQLYAQLDADLGQITVGSIFETFMNTESTTTVGQFHEVQSNTEDSYTLQAGDAANLLQYKADIENTIYEIQERDSLIAGSNDPVQIAVWETEKDSLLNLLSTQTTNWYSLHHQIKNNKANAIAQVAGTISSIVTTTLHETNEQSLNNIYLSTYAIDILPDSIQLLALEAIANQCPLEGGIAVYRARALVQGTGYDDVTLCDRGGGRNEKQGEVQSKLFALYPNPSDGQINLQLPIGTVESVLIHNSIGMLVGEWNGIDFPPYWTISNLNLNEGMYYCTVTTIHTKQTQSFVIIK